jgi:hypothetical protein
MEENFWDRTVWRAIHFLTMRLFKHRIVRGYRNTDGKLIRIYWDHAVHWPCWNERNADSEWPKPIWERE